MIGALKGLAGFALDWVLMFVFAAVFAVAFCASAAVVLLFMGQWPAALVLTACALLAGGVLWAFTGFIDWANDRLYP